MITWLLFHRFVQPCRGCLCQSRTAIPFNGAATCGCTMAWSVSTLPMLAHKSRGGELTVSPQKLLSMSRAKNHV